MIRRGLLAVKQNLIWAVVGALVAGLVAGQVVGAGTRTLLRAAVLPVLFVMIYPMMISIDLWEVANVRRHAGTVGTTLLVNFGLVPLVAVGIARVFFAGDPSYAVGLYLVALVPTSGMTAAWTGLADGDLEGALVAMAVNLVVAVVLLPAYLSVLVPGEVPVDATALYRQLGVVVAAPMVAGAVTRRLSLARHGTRTFERMKPLLGGVSSVGVVLIVFVAMAMRSTSVLADPLASASVVVPLLAFYAVVLGSGALVGRTLLTPPRAVAVVYATSMRNLSIALALVVTPGFPPAEAVLPVALSYLLQPPLGALYMHYRRDVVGENRSLRDLLAT